MSRRSVWPMPSVERLYERPLKRPVDGTIRDAINALVARRRHELPVPAEFEWHATDPVLTIRSSLLSFIVSFAAEHFTVDARMSLAARIFATDANKKKAAQFFETIAEELNL
jgi:hypothetical protein